mgnify:CR=1 FL=1
MKKIVGIINMLCIAILLYSCAEESVGQTPVDNMPPQNVTGVQAVSYTHLTLPTNARV